MALPPPVIHSVAGSMYVAEIRDLLDSLLFRIHTLKHARDSWLAHESTASVQAALAPEDFNHQAFADALNAATQQQTTIFDAFEALLAGWARLSLLFHPIGGKDRFAPWRLDRGKTLRKILDLPDNTLLASRTFRDSWMHFDERLDVAVIEGWLGNRQQFAKTAGVPKAVQHSVRVIDIEALAFHYRTRDGLQEHVTIQQMEDCLDLVTAGLKDVGSRIMQFLPSA